MRVVVVVLNWRALRETLACLRGLKQQDYEEFAVVVVDNGSDDGSPAALRAAVPWAEVIETGRNLGYAGGNNVGLRRALALGAEFVLILNNDTILPPDLLRKLVAAAEAHPQAGMFGPTIYYADRPSLIWSAGGRLDRRDGRTWMLTEATTEVRRVDFLSGCALFARRAVLEEAGLLDEDFFLYYEDVEWGVRAARHGFVSLHLPQVMLWHAIPRDGRESSPMVHYFMTRNRYLFLRRSGAPWQAQARALLEDLRLIAVWTVRRRWRRTKRAQRRARLLGLRDAFLGRWGPGAMREVLGG